MNCILLSNGNNYSSFTNLELVKSISFIKRKELIKDTYVYFYELLLDDKPSHRLYFSDFKDKLNEIKNYTDEEYCSLFDTLCNISKNQLSSATTLNIKKFGWSKVKDFFEKLTFKESLIINNYVYMSFQLADCLNLYKYFWALIYLKNLS